MSGWKKSCIIISLLIILISIPICLYYKFGDLNNKEKIDKKDTVHSSVIQTEMNIITLKNKRALPGVISSNKDVEQLIEDTIRNQ